MTKTCLTYEDINAMYAAATCLRDRLIAAFYYDTGIRCSELLRVRIQDIDLARKTVVIPHLKRGTHKKCPKCARRGGRSTTFCSKCGYDMSQVEAEGIEERTRIIEIGDELVALIKEFLTGQETKPEDRLIDVSRQAVYQIIRQLAKRAGLGGAILINPDTGKAHFVHPHSFRDSLAVDWLEIAGADATKQKALQTALGHKNFETTMRYNKLTPAAVSIVHNEVREKRKDK